MSDLSFISLGPEAAIGAVTAITVAESASDRSEMHHHRVKLGWWLRTDTFHASRSSCPDPQLPYCAPGIKADSLERGCDHRDFCHRPSKQSHFVLLCGQPATSFASAPHRVHSSYDAWPGQDTVQRLCSCGSRKPSSHPFDDRPLTSPLVVQCMSRCCQPRF